MKRVNLIFKHCASVMHLPKPAIVLAVIMALGLSLAPDINAQRHGGGGGRGMGYSGGSARGMGYSSGAHIGQSYGHINGSRSYNGNLGRAGHAGGYYGGHYYGYRGLPYWRYAYYPFWGDYFWGLPPYALWFYLDGYNYYNGDGIYYKQEDDKYEVVPAPLGHTVKTLPKGSYEFSLNGEKYFYYFGTYYVPRKGQYEVVEPPIGAEVDSIPDGYEKVMIDGQTYFTLSGVQYKAVMKNNVIWYKVIKNDSNNTAPANGNNTAPSNHPTGEEPM